MQRMPPPTSPFPPTPLHLPFPTPSTSPTLFAAPTPSTGPRHDECIDRNVRLDAWKPVPIAEVDHSKLVTPRWRYRYKTRSDGSLERRSARCTVRGDLMLPGIHFDPAKTFAQSPSYVAQRLFYAHVAVNGEELEEWNVPAAYPRAETDPNFVNFLRQPKRSDGSLTFPGCHFQICRAQQGAPDAGFCWEEHRDRRLAALGWKKLKSEPGAFIITRGNSTARLLCSTDDFLVSSNDSTFLSFLRKQLQNEWNITVQQPVTQHTGIAVAKASK